MSMRLPFLRIWIRTKSYIPKCEKQTCHEWAQWNLATLWISGQDNLRNNDSSLRPARRKIGQTDWQPLKWLTGPLRLEAEAQRRPQLTPGASCQYPPTRVHLFPASKHRKKYIISRRQKTTYIYYYNTIPRKSNNTSIIFYIFVKAAR